MSFESLIERVHKLNTTIGGNWKPEYQLIWILEELGEVSREFLQKQNLPAKSNQYNENKLTEEIGDVLYGLVSFANSLEIDIGNCLAMAVEKFENRHGQ